MPDGDIVHSKLAPIFHSAYRSMCSDGFDPEEEAHESAIPLKKLLQSRGDSPLHFLDECYERLKDGIPTNPGQIIDELARQYYGDQSGMEVARDAVSRYIDDCRYDGYPVEREELVKGYIKQTYIADFCEKIPLNVEHYNYIHPDEFSDRLIAIEPFIDREVQTFAKQMMRDNSTANLRRRPYRGATIGLYDEAY